MGKLIKTLLAVFAVLVLVVALVAVVAPLLIDPNDYKDRIAALVKERSGRDLTLEGDLSLSVFPWLGVEVGGASLGNAPGFGAQPFAAIDEAEVKVKVLPLLSKRVEVSEIVLKGLRLNLAKNAQGQSNWSDLTAARGKTAKPAETAPAQPEERAEKERPQAGGESPALAALMIGGVVLEDGRVVWDDAQAGQHLEVDALNFHVDRIAFDQAIDFRLALKVKADRAGLEESLDLSGAVTVNQRLDRFQLERLRLISSTRGEAIPGGVLDTRLEAARALADMSQQSLQVEGIELSAADELVIEADLKGEKILEAPILTGSLKVARFNPRKVLRALALPVPETRDPAVLADGMLQLNLDASREHLRLSAIQLQLDDSRATGSVAVSDFQNPAIVFDFSVDAIDIDRYLPPKAQEPQPEAPATAAGNGGAGPAGSQSAPAKPAPQLPMEALRRLNLKGALMIGRLRAGGVYAEGVRVEVDGKNGLIHSTQKVEKFYQGRYQGAVLMDVRGKQPQFTLDEQLAEVQLEPLLKDLQGKALLSGNARVNAKLKARGLDPEAIKSSLDGTVDALFTDGAVHGINLIKFAREARAKLEGKPVEEGSLPDKTEFSELKMLARIDQGLVNNETLTAKSPLFRVNGQGTADLKTEALDYKVNAKIVGSLEGQGGEDLEALKGIPVAIKIGGTFSKPRLRLDLETMLKEEQKAKIVEKKQELQGKIDEKKEKLQEKLEEKLPGAGELLKKFF